MYFSKNLQNFQPDQQQEWLVTNSLGSYASGTVANILTRSYHGLLVSANNPPLERTVLVSKIDDTAIYNDLSYPLFSNCWADGLIEPKEYQYLESFCLEGTIPVWRFAFQDAKLEKRIWMQTFTNTTYINYSLVQANQPVKLFLKVLVNYRNHHTKTKADNWKMKLEPLRQGIKITAFPGAIPFYIFINKGDILPVHQWYYGFKLVRETERGLDDLDDNLYAANINVTIAPQENFTIVASVEDQPDLDGVKQLETRYQYEQQLLKSWQLANPNLSKQAPDWIKQLVLAADQFIVNRPLTNGSIGKTIIAGYHWFTDWGRDTMIALPGLTLSVGRPEIARQIIFTFGQYINQGMLPNRFPDDGSPLTEGDYNTVDATLWYFQAIHSYYEITKDEELLQHIFPLLAEIIDWHCQGTRCGIKVDSDDGLLYAGEPGLQLTWMDAKWGDTVFTPRIGKPVEINALWYNALCTMSLFAQQLHKSSSLYDQLAETTLKGFARFWHESKEYCFDVLDTPQGNDDSHRPNQIFAVSLRESPLNPLQQEKVVETCEQFLLTTLGLRSLAPQDPQYQGIYLGSPQERDRAYHQGTVWGWLLGPYLLAHWRVFRNPTIIGQLLEPIKNHLQTAGIGSISEIFDGDFPYAPKGCIAQAWSVAEVLRASLTLPYTPTP